MSKETLISGIGEGDLDLLWALFLRHYKGDLVHELVGSWRAVLEVGAVPSFAGSMRC